MSSSTCLASFDRSYWTRQLGAAIVLARTCSALRCTLFDLQCRLRGVSRGNVLVWCDGAFHEVYSSLASRMHGGCAAQLPLRGRTPRGADAAGFRRAFHSGAGDGGAGQSEAPLPSFTSEAPFHMVDEYRALPFAGMHTTLY